MLHVSREPGLQMTPDLYLLQGPAEWQNRATIKQGHHPSGFGLSGQMLWSLSKSLISPEDQRHPMFAIFCTATGSGQTAHSLVRAMASLRMGLVTKWALGLETLCNLREPKSVLGVTDGNQT